jgi:hypothetical protein
MLTYRSSVSIDRPAAVVFRYLATPELQALWSDVPMQRSETGPLRTGSRMQVTFAGGPLKAVIGLLIGALEPDRRLAFESFSGPIRWDGEYRLTAVGDTTTVEQEGRLRFTGLWRVLEPIVGAEISRGEVRELERLKAAVESHEARE